MEREVIDCLLEGKVVDVLQLKNSKKKIIVVTDSYNRTIPLVLYPELADTVVIEKGNIVRCDVFLNGMAVKTNTGETKYFANLDIVDIIILEKN
jgi:hypothetical protein